MSNLWDRRRDLSDPIADAIEDRGPHRHIVGPEAVFGEIDFQPVDVLERALSQSRSVGRIVVRNEAGAVFNHGTGSLVGDGLLLTNSHVLATPDVAANSLVEFNFLKADSDGNPIGDFDTYELDPTVFETSPYRPHEEGGVDRDHLDYTVVRVAPKGGQSAAEKWGTTEVATEQKWLAVGNDVFIVQHPKGQPKQVSMARNEVVHIGELVFFYLTDTLPGSSGSAVCDTTWRMAGLHHAAGRYQAQDGQSYAANEAVLIGSVLADLSDDLRSRITAGSGLTR